MSKIEWTGESWNPIVGCSIKSTGCAKCYAVPQAWIRSHHPNPKISDKFAGTVEKTQSGQLLWTGKLNFSYDALLIPLRRKKPQTYFVNSMSDLFHEDLDWDVIDLVMAVIVLCPQHDFQILTKRGDVMRDYMKADRRDEINAIAGTLVDWDEMPEDAQWPPRNAWLGVSVEDQKRANERIPQLLDTPAAIRWISAEPLLEEVDLTWIEFKNERGGDEIWDALKVDGAAELIHSDGNWSTLDWVVVGGESGRGAREFKEEWLAKLIAQCRVSKTAVFAKQMGGAPKGSLPEIPEHLMVRQYPRQPAGLEA